MAKNYVDNKLLLQEMIKYTDSYKAAKLAGTTPPKANDYIGECIWLIATRLSTNRNFIGYSYREEMIGDAIENTLRYLHNFDAEKSSNPFAYFTQIMYYAFLRRIEKEKKQTYIKYKTMENSIAMNTLVSLSPEDTTHFNAFIVNMDYEKLTALSEKYETKQASKKAAKKTGIENFIGEDKDEQPI
jgi:hypothetical protein